MQNRNTEDEKRRLSLDLPLEWQLAAYANITNQYLTHEVSILGLLPIASEPAASSQVEVEGPCQFVRDEILAHDMQALVLPPQRTASEAGLTRRQMKRIRRLKRIEKYEGDPEQAFVAGKRKPQGGCEKEEAAVCTGRLRRHLQGAVKKFIVEDGRPSRKNS